MIGYVRNSGHSFRRILNNSVPVRRGQSSGSPISPLRTAFLVLRTELSIPAEQVMKNTLLEQPTAGP